MPAPKKKKTIMESLGLKKAPEKSPGQVAAERRSAGDAIAAELMAVDFVGGAYEGRTDQDSVEILERKVAALIRVLKNAPTIVDNIAGMDEVLLYAAQALRYGVKEGYYNKVIWAKNALCTGVLYLRDNVPDDHADQRQEIMDARLKYMKHYKTIIQAYEKADAKAKTVAEYDENLKNKHAEYDPNAEKIKAMKDTPEGRLMFGRIKLNENTPDALNEEEKRFLELVRMTAAAAHTIYLLNSSRTATELEYETALEQAADIRVVLINRPDVFNHQLTALHALAMEEQIANIAASFAEAAQAMENIKRSEAKLRTVMDGADAQAVAHHAVSFMEKVLEGDQNDEIGAAMEGNRMAKRANQALQAQKEAHLAAQEALNEAQNAETDEDMSALFSDSVHFDTNMDTETAEQSDTSTETAEQFVYNSI